MESDKSVDELVALAGDGVSELFGWPVPLLDEIRGLSELANKSEIWINEWRRRDAELRARGPQVFDRDQVESNARAAQRVWLDDLVDDLELQRKLFRLERRLWAALRAAPNDDDLRARLERIDDLLADPDRRDEKAEWQRRRELVTHWLAAPDLSMIDDVSGLPWEYLAEYRWLPDPILGRVPAYLGIARKHAQANALEDMVHRARTLLPDAEHNLAAASELSQMALTRLPSLVIEMASDGDHDAQALIGHVRQLWDDPAMRRLLLRETAAGWPPHLRDTEPGSSAGD